MKKYFSIKEILWMIFFSIVVSAIYLAYFFVIGIPKTQARNYFNKGMESIDQGAFNDAEKAFEKGRGFWNELYFPKGDL